MAEVLLGEYEKLLQALLPTDSGASKHTLSAILELQKGLGITNVQHQAALMGIGLSPQEVDDRLDAELRLDKYQELLVQSFVKNLIFTDKQMLDTFRTENRISDALHLRALGAIGWSEDDLANHFAGQTRSCIESYKTLIKRALRSDFIRDEDDRALIEYRKLHGVSHHEHNKVLDELGSTPAVFNAKRVLRLRRVRRDAEQQHENDDLELSQLVERLQTAQATGKRLMSQLDTATKELATTEANVERVEDNIVRIKDSMSELDVQVTLAKDKLQTTESACVRIADETQTLEGQVEEKNTEVMQLSSKISELSAQLRDRDKRISIVESTASNVLEHMQAAKATVPKEFRQVDDLYEAEKRQKRMFRTACVAVASAVLTKEEADSINIDSDTLYASMRLKGLDTSEWKDFIVQHIRNEQRHRAARASIASVATTTAASRLVDDNDEMHANKIQQARSLMRNQRSSTTQIVAAVGIRERRSVEESD